MTFMTFLRENWLFLTAGVLISFTSSYGQTFFISLFAGRIMADFGLSHGDWGLIYTVATSAAAVAMVWAGGLTDRFRIRGLSVFTCLALAASCVAMAMGQGV